MQRQHAMLRSRNRSPADVSTSQEKFWTDGKISLHEAEEVHGAKRRDRIPNKLKYTTLLVIFKNSSSSPSRSVAPPSCPCTI